MIEWDNEREIERERENEKMIEWGNEREIERDLEKEKEREKET
jgi:hypothetical protein